MNWFRRGPIKKGLIIAAALIFICTSVSCSSDSKPVLDRSNPVTISMWHHYKGGQVEALQEAISEFNSTVGKDQGIVVRAVGMHSVGEIYDQLIQSADNEPGSPKLPDLAMVYPDAANTLYSRGLVASFEKYLEPEKLDAYVDSFLDEGRLDRSLYIFPVSKSTEALMVNNTVYQNFLAEYNAANPENKLSEAMLGSFEGIVKTAEAYYKWTDAQTPGIPNDGLALYGMDSTANFAIVGYHQMGQDFFVVSDDGTGSINFDRETFRRLWACYYIPMVKGHFAAYSFYRAEDTQTGDVLMYTGSTAGAAFFPTTVTYRDNTKIDIELKALPFPVFAGGKKATVQQGAGMVIHKSTPEKEYAATIFLNWLTEPERNTDFVLKTGYLPVTYAAMDDILPDKLEKMGNDPDLKNTVQVISMALTMRDNYSFYTYRPFKNSEDIRLYFEEIFLEKARTARAEYVRHLDNGGSIAEAEQTYLSEAAMESFIEEVEHEIGKWQK